jgi:hypothetical protein
MAEYNDITQVPFVSGQGAAQQPLLPPQQPQPLLADVPTDALAAQITGELGPDKLPVEPLIAYQQAMKVKDRTDAIQQAQLDLAKTDAQQNSFMPKFIATVAALKGDFRPLMQMEEQKRKTAIGKALFPTQLKINEYVSQGDYESAENLANTAYQAAGARSEALVPYFQQIQKDISAKRTQIQNMKTRYEMLKIAVGDDKNNPNYKFVQALGAFMKNPTPDSEAGFNQFMSENKPQIQVGDTKVTTVSPMTGQITETPTTQFAPSSAADTISGKEVVQVHGLKSTADITNLQRGIGVTDINGQVIAPGSQRAQTIIAEMSTRQKDEAAYELKKMIVTDPMLNSAFIAAGGKIKDLATGNITREDMSKAFDVILQRKMTENEAAIMVKLMKDPAYWAGTGGTYIDKDLKEYPQKSVYDAEQQGLLPVRQKTLDTIIRPLQERIQGLDYAVEMVNELKKEGISLETNGERISQGIKDSISKVLGVSVSKSVLIKTTIAEIMNKAVEQTGQGLANIGRPSAEIGRIKKFTSGDFASTDDAIQALTILQGKLKQEMLNSISVTPQTALPSRAPSGTPYVPQSDTSIVSPKGGGRIPKGAAVTKGDVEGALKRYGGEQGGAATPATGTSATSATQGKKPYTLIPGSGR